MRVVTGSSTSCHRSSGRRARESEGPRATKVAAASSIGGSLRRTRQLRRWHLSGDRDGLPRTASKAGGSSVGVRRGLDQAAPIARLRMGLGAVDWMEVTSTGIGRVAADQA